METLFETYVLNGGPLMVVLLLCSLILFTVVIRDLIRYRPERVLPAKLRKEAEAWTPRSDPAEIARRLNEEASPLGRVLAIAHERWLERRLMGEHQVPLSEFVDDATQQVADDLYEDLGPLSTIYTVAPLLGLLGTILGMMTSFREYARVADRDLSLLSEGIQQALVTTLWGLAISILAYIAARYFEGRIRRFEREVLPPRALAILERLAGVGGWAVPPADAASTGGAGDVNTPAMAPASGPGQGSGAA